jgi:hypothetical protein
MESTVPEKVSCPSCWEINATGRTYGHSRPLHLHGPDLSPDIRETAIQTLGKKQSTQQSGVSGRPERLHL